MPSSRAPAAPMSPSTAMQARPTARTWPPVPRLPTASAHGPWPSTAPGAAVPCRPTRRSTRRCRWSWVSSSAPTSPAQSPAYGSTRAQATPAPTSAVCGPRVASCWPAPPSPARPRPGGSRSASRPLWPSQPTRSTWPPTSHPTAATPTTAPTSPPPVSSTARSSCCRTACPAAMVSTPTTRRRPSLATLSTPPTTGSTSCSTMPVRPTRRRRR